ncbi:MAG: DNA alkylation repair protein [Candidatus Bipolaricaulis sp.]|nr:DNA alkylation repair protein [Candidatus Bipolaricaulis sp.]
MRAEIDRAIAGGEMDALARFLVGGRTSSARYAARRLAERAAEAGMLSETTAGLAEHVEPVMRQLAALLCYDAYPDAPDRTIARLRGLADDEEPSVRDAASESAGRLLDDQFPGVVSRVEPWRAHSSANVRHALLVAVVHAARHGQVDRAEPLLRLIGPLLTDRDPLVRRALGPAAVAALLQQYPALTFEHLIQWSTSNDEQVLWNVAMAFTSPAASEMAKKALIVLRKLSLDERRYVWRAVAAARWKLGRRRPEIVRPELARWLEDDERVEVARAALTYL